ncbi:MAG: DUF192 domain-containing protein [Bdellovibrionales bacterium]
MRLKSKSRILIENLEIADSLWSRCKGLLGRSSLPPGHALWIKPCNSVHTFFMKFAIDLVFLDRQMTVTKTYSRVPPGRLIGPVWRASSVIEFREGFLDESPLSMGEQLHVDSALS